MSMSFGKALSLLGISDYADKIISSNSRGEMGHLLSYISIARHYEANKEDVSWFRNWFITVVEGAKDHWERPESIYQHILPFLDDYLGEDDA